MNIARRHFLRTLARQSASGGAPGAGGGAGSPPGSAPQSGPDAGPGVPDGDPVAQAMLVKLAADRARLKQIQSVEGKAALKAELLPDYAPWIEGLLAGADDLPEGQPQDVLTVVMLWAFDCDRIAYGLSIARVVLARQIPLPAWFNRTAATMIAEEVAEAAFRALRATGDGPPDLGYWVAATIDLVEGHDMPDEVRAKLFKAAAQLLERQIAAIDAAGQAPDGAAGLLTASAELGIAHATRALALHPKCGVKATLDALRRRLKRAGAEAPATSPPATPATANPG